MNLPQSYDELVLQAQQADDPERRQLLDQLIRQFAEAAYRWALVVLEDENAARDAVQEAWLNAYLHLDQLKEGTAFPAWLRQIVLTSSYHAIRREKPSLPLTEQASEQATTADPTEEAEYRERQERIRQAVLALPEHERIVIELFYFADYPQQEIAEVLSVPVTTVKKRLQYARERLKSLIQPDIVAQLPLYAFNGGSMADWEELAEVPLEWSAMDNLMELMEAWPPSGTPVGALPINPLAMWKPH